MQLLQWISIGASTFSSLSLLWIMMILQNQESFQFGSRFKINQNKNYQSTLRLGHWSPPFVRVPNKHTKELVVSI